MTIVTKIPAAIIRKAEGGKTTLTSRRRTPIRADELRINEVVHLRVG